MLFVQLDEGVPLDGALRGRIAGDLRTTLSPRHVPDEVHAVPAIPRTHSGKKLEVPVKRILAGSPVADVVSVGALADPAALEPFVEISLPARLSVGSAGRPGQRLHLEVLVESGHAVLPTDPTVLEATEGDVGGVEAPRR